MKEQHRITRRQFMKSAGAVGAGVAAAGTLGGGLSAPALAALPASQTVQPAATNRPAVEIPKEFTTFDADVLVVGAGAAGVEAAISAAKSGANVIIVDKKRFGRCGDSGIKGNSQMTSSWLGLDGDNVDIHLQDGVESGQWVVDQKLGEAVIQAYADDKVMLKSENYGNVHERDPQTGEPVISKSRNKPRSWPGYKLINHAYEAIKIGCKVMEYCMVTSLLTDDGGAVVGATAIDFHTGAFYVIRAKATVLATGGDCQLWGAGTVVALHGGGVTGLTGDGHAMAAALGAEFRDLEFRSMPTNGSVQYPTAISNWCCGYGTPPDFTDKDGVKFLEGIPAEELTTRRVHYEVEKMLAEGRGGPHGGFFAPVQYETLVNKGFWTRTETMHLRIWEKNGLDLSRVEQHFGHTYDYGGIVSNEKAETGVPGLYAAGETTMHSAAGYGAFRMFSSAFVTGRWAGENGAARAKELKTAVVDMSQVEAEYERVFGILYATPDNPLRVHQVRHKVQEAAWKGSGNWRSEKKCLEALSELDGVEKDDLPRMYVADKSKVCNLEWMEALETFNMIVMARMDTLAALTRTESRGTHLRNEYPDMDNDNWLKNVYIKMEDGELKVETRPVIVTKFEPPSGKFPQGGGTLPE